MYNNYFYIRSLNQIEHLTKGTWYKMHGVVISYIFYGKAFSLQMETLNVNYKFD